MNAELHLLFGILLIHGVWILAYGTGMLLDARHAPPQTRAEALTTVVARSASGLALWGFGAFVLGLAGALTWWGMLALGVAFAICARCAYGPAYVTAAFWRAQLAQVGLAFGAVELVLYYTVLLAAVPAIFPAVDSDSVRYHLAYAADWAGHGRIYPDLFLRLPFYATNFLLIFTLFDVAHVPQYVHFATWLCGMLGVLAIRAAIGLIEDARPRPATVLGEASRTAAALALPLTFIISPVYLRWGATALVDVPIAVFAFVPVLCTAAALSKRLDLRWAAVVTAAFFIGMKTSLIVFVPLMAGLVWAGIAASGGTRKARTVALAVLVIASSPWYVRNMIYDHDPVAPALNIALHRPDVTYSQEDAERNLADLQMDRSARALLKLPFTMWHDSGLLREYGSIGLNLLLFVPLGALLVAAAAGVRDGRDRAVVAMCAAVAYGLAYCIATSYLLRYLLIVEPALAASIGALAWRLPDGRAAALGRIAVAAVSVLPTPGSLPYYRLWFENRIRDVEPYYNNDDDYNRRMLAGWPEIKTVLSSAPFSGHGAHRPRVLLMQVEAEYYFRRAGIETVGDWFGPGRYEDLQIALDNDRLPHYISRFDIGAVIARNSGSAFDPAERRKLVDGLRKLGFRIAENAPDGYLVAIRSEDHESRRTQDHG